MSASSSVPAPLRKDGLRTASGLRGIPPYRWIDLGLVIVLALIASILFVPPFGSPVGARAAAIGIGAGAVVAVVCLVGRLGPAPTLALTALVHVGAGPWVLPDTGSGWKAVRAVLAATVTVWRDALTLPVPLTAFPSMTVLPWLVGLIAGVIATRAALSGRVLIAGMTVMAQAGLAIAWGVRTALMPTELGVVLVTGVLLLWAVTAQRGRRERVAEVLESKDAGVGRGSRRGFLRVLALLTVTGTVVALAIPAAPHNRTVLRDLFEPPLDLTEYATPLSLVRTLETDMASDSLMAVSGADESTRIRLAALDSYDGLSARISASANGAARFQRIGKTRQIGEAVVAGGVGVEAVFAETVDEFKGEVVRGARDYGEGQRAGEVHEMLPGGAGVLVWHGKSLRYNARSFYRGLQDGLE